MSEEDIKQYNIKQTSRKTAGINDVVLQSSKKTSDRTRQILRSEIIGDNNKNPDNTLRIAIIHEKADENGNWNTKYTDLRRIEMGESIRIQLTTSQTKQLYNELGNQYETSKIGVSSGNRFVVSGVSDFSNIVIESDATKLNLIQKLISQIPKEKILELLTADVTKIGIINNISQIRIDILEQLLQKFKEKIVDGNEKNIQNWIDEEPKLRCLVFGLEYIDYKREVQFNNSRFDLLTEQSGSEHIVIELKSPTAKVFEIKEIILKNGTKKEYVLSKDLSEAIPQTIKYFREYEQGNDETFQKVGSKKRKLQKALIIIGKKDTDTIWQQHFCDLNNRISGIEIITYDHLVEKIENQIRNLKSLENSV